MTNTIHAGDMPTNLEWNEMFGEHRPRQGQWSEEEYLTLTDHCNCLIEFTDGFVEFLPMPTDEHQTLLKLLFLTFFQYFEARGGIVLFAPLRVKIRPRKFREPDLLLLLSSEDPRRHNRFWNGADLPLEVVSEDKPERDLIDKRGDYAEAQVPEYWIVNPQMDTIMVLRLGNKGYEEAGIYARGTRATSVLRPEFSVAVDELFDSARASKQKPAQPDNSK